MSTDWFLKVDGVVGESTADRYQGAIEVEAWSWGLSNSTSVGGATGSTVSAGKPTFERLNVMARVSSASPQLLRACAVGAVIKSVVLSGVRLGGKAPLEFATYTLSDAFVSSAQQSGSSGDVPSEQLALGFRRVQVDYRPQLPDGSLGKAVTFRYDVATAKA